MASVARLFRASLACARSSEPTLSMHSEKVSNSRCRAHSLDAIRRGRLMWINGQRCAAGQKRPMVPLRMRSASAMRLHSYRDESHSRHFDLIGGGGHSWSVDLVSVTASGILAVGFVCALMANWVH